MHDSLLRTLIAVRTVSSGLRARAAQEYGEGVISAAIAVLVMAFLGVAMWLAFSDMFDGATEQIRSNVEQIGN